MAGPDPLMNRLARKLPIVMILIAAVAGAVTLRGYMNFQTLEANREALLAVRDAHYIWTSVVFILAYAVAVVVSIPGAVFLTMAGGFMFGLFPGAVYNVIAATFGAIVVFLAARLGFGADIARRIEARGGAVGRLQNSLRDNEWSVLLTMRLIPVLPFFVTNLMPAFVGVRFSTFAITTFIGVIPADLIYTSLGSGLGDIFSRGEVPDLGIVFAPKFLLPLIGLVVLAMLPFLLRLARRARG